MTAWILLSRNQLMGFLRESAAAIFNLAVPLFIIVLQAVAYGDTTVGSSLPGYDVSDLLPISAAVFYVLIIGIFGMAIGLAAMTEARTLSTFRLRPGGLASILSAYGVVLGVLAFVGLSVATLTLAAGWGVQAPARPALLLPATLLSLGMSLSLGAVVGGVSSSPRAAQGIASAIFFPLLFLSGATLPIEKFPAGLRHLSELLPGHQLYELFSYAWLPSENAPVGAVAYVVAVIAVASWYAIRIFSRREDL